MVPGCDITIEPRNAIFASVRMDTTFDSFFEKGGVGTFKGRMAQALGIKPHNMKVVRAYRGSVIVDFFLFDEDDDQDSLDQLQTHFVATIQSVGTFLGGPVISYSYGSRLENAFVMPGYEDFVANEKKEDEKAADAWILEQLGIDDSDLDVDVKMIYVVTGGQEKVDDQSFNLAIVIVIAVVLGSLIIVTLFKLVWPKCKRTSNAKKHIEHIGPLKSLDVQTKSNRDQVDRYDVEA